MWPGLEPGYRFTEQGYSLLRSPQTTLPLLEEPLAAFRVLFPLLSLSQHPG